MTLTARHALVLAWLRAHPDTSATEIAEGVGEDVDAVVQCCIDLAVDGLIEVAPIGHA